MHAVIRLYSGHGAPELFRLLEEKKDEVRDAISKVQGFQSYTLIQSERGGASVTVCRTKHGTDESSRVARRWIEAHAADLVLAAPNVAEGDVILAFDGAETPA